MAARAGEEREVAEVRERLCVSVCVCVCVCVCFISKK